LNAEIYAKSFETTNSLTAGVLYSFKVSASNQVGEGAQSNAVQIYAASVPDAPLSLTANSALTNANQVALSYAEGSYNGGSPVIDFQIEYR